VNIKLLNERVDHNISTDSNNEINIENPTTAADILKFLMNHILKLEHFVQK